jgi:hypothetical protein
MGSAQENVRTEAIRDISVLPMSNAIANAIFFRPPQGGKALLDWAWCLGNRVDCLCGSPTHSATRFAGDV